MKRLAVITVTTIAVLGQPGSGNRERVKVNPKDGLTYVWIPPRTFWMGCSAADAECFSWEMPAREVAVNRGFWMGETEVTQEAYQRVTGTNPSHYRGARLPVDQVSWHDAENYCVQVGMRLPTAVEWEYAARGGVAAPRYGDLNSVAWYDANSGDTTHPVAEKAPNGFGLYDTLGNLWEWVQDDYLDSGKKLKVLRGASFFNPFRDVRVSNPLWAVPETAHRDMGIRCAGD
jgi:formylglycine-generating enzyme required for sulfatase activity